MGSEEGAEDPGGEFLVADAEEFGLGAFAGGDGDDLLHNEGAAVTLLGMRSMRKPGQAEPELWGCGGRTK